MAHRESAPVTINVNVEGLEKIAERLTTSLGTIDAINRVMRDHARILQRRAVANVSGITRNFKGTDFVVNRVTGKLARSIQTSLPNPLAIVGEASAEYASDVELGTRGPVDLKKTKLAGKIVPLPVNPKAAIKQQSALAQAGSKVFKKLDSKGNPITTVGGIRVQNKYATTGKVMGKTGVRFLRVPGPGGKGWIIPQRPPRPFMEEAAAYTEPLLKEAAEAAYKSFLEEGD